MNSFRGIEFVMLGAVLVATPATVSAENWVEVGHYSMLVDKDSVHRGAGDIVYYTWRNTYPDMGLDPHAAAVRCLDKMSYSDVLEPNWASKGQVLHPHTMMGRLLEFVCGISS